MMHRCTPVMKLITFLEICFFFQHFDEKDSATRNDNATIQIQTLAVHRLNYFYFSSKL